MHASSSQGPSLRVPSLLDRHCPFPYSSFLLIGIKTRNRMSSIAAPDEIMIRPHADLHMDRLLHKNIDHNPPSQRIPNEILDHIIEIALWIAVLQAPYSNIFPIIASFSLASTTFRQIALRRYFNTVILYDTEQWTGLFKLLESQERKKPMRGGDGGFAWVRSVYARSFVLQLPRPDILIVERSGRHPKSCFQSRLD